ncbi:MAG TPA: OmpH family outer membrane protein [Tepidisphaeraceae bacterium]|jgi:Skp family chaperone for outer membrane proteins|nr:OmpH family outer membrane protein [Tepidisphaeraceae bacterium]
MKYRSLLPVLFVGVLAAAASAAPAQATKIAIANPSRIFNEMQETKDLREKLEAKRKELEATEQQKRGAISDYIGQMRQLRPGSPQAKDMAEKIDAAKAELQGWGAVSRAGAERDQKIMIKSLYDKIEAAIGDVAKQDALDLVLTDGRQDPGNIEEITFEDLRRMLNGRNVLFSTKSIDISEKVIAVLDKNYAAAKTK